MSTATLTEQTMKLRPGLNWSTLMGSTSMPLSFSVDADMDQTELLASAGPLMGGKASGITVSEGTTPELSYIAGLFHEVKWPQSSNIMIGGNLAQAADLSIYDAMLEHSYQDAVASWQGTVSVRLSPCDISYATSRGSKYVYALSNDLLLHCRSSLPIETGVEQIGKVDQCMMSLQQELELIVHLSPDSLGESTLAFKEETIETCKGLIKSVGGYLAGSDLTGTSPFLIPSPDGTVLFKWVVKEKELSIMVEESLLQVQRWNPISSYESEGYWEISLSEIGDQFDWLTR